jgi:hypothetical protein
MMVLYCLLLSATGPESSIPAMEFTRAGIACSELVEPPVVPLIGEVRLTLTAAGAAPLAVDPIKFADPPGWHVRATDPATISDQPGGKQQWRASFRLTPDKPGDLPLLPPTIRVRAGGRETPVQIDWLPLMVHVTTTLSRVDLDEAHGVTGPEPAPPAATPFWMDERSWAAAMAVIAVFTAVWVGLSLRPPPTPEPLPKEWAAAELDRLAGLDPTAPASADALADLLRDFLEREHHIPAAGKTTAELLDLFRSWPGQLALNWGPLLEGCDLARFANAGFSVEEWASAIEQARRVTAATLPIGEAAAPAATGSTGENA